MVIIRIKFHFGNFRLHQVSALFGIKGRGILRDKFSSLTVVKKDYANFCEPSIVVHIGLETNLI